ncbi:hypothetical protein ACFQY7_37015 [Actinomadura luteofluorescens]|uniref:hypothetical protein n=1 Tax=Actinomadura luteofluorescens TaxID=46163 RepID=UPI00362C5000
MLAFMDSIKGDLSPVVVPPKGAMEMEDILKRATDSVLFGKAQPDAAAKTFLTEADNALS